MATRRKFVFGTVFSSACLAATIACKPAPDEPTTDTEPVADATASKSRLATSASIDPALAEPIRLSKAVPADAAAVVVIRSPESLFEKAALHSWLGPRDPALDAAMIAELDSFLRDRIGMKLTGVTGLTVFYAASPERVGVIIDGIEGEPKGEERGRHGDTVLRSLDGSEDLLAAGRGSQLLLGNAEALGQMLDALDGKIPALVDDTGELATLLARETAGAGFAVVAELARLPEEIAQPAAQMGIERGYVGIGGQGLHAVALGTPEGMQSAAKLVELGLVQAQAELDKQKQAAIAGDDTLLGAAAIIGSHTSKQLSKILQPELDGGRMTIDVPISLGDGTTVVAILGVAAAVAVPALQKYMRRAKTAEAKVQLAKLYDATSAYFTAEHVARGADLAAPVAAHQCPNNGQLSGEAGVTPPLSVNCNEGPGGRCVPSSDDAGAGYYDSAVWTNNPVWEQLNFLQETGHYFHYNFIWANSAEGYGSCQFTVQAFADLDDDGVFSTFERYGAGDLEGVNAAIGLYIDNEVE